MHHLRFCVPIFLLCFLIHIVHCRQDRKNLQLPCCLGNDVCLDYHIQDNTNSHLLSFLWEHVLFANYCYSLPLSQNRAVNPYHSPYRLDINWYFMMSISHSPQECQPDVEKQGWNSWPYSGRPHPAFGKLQAILPKSTFPKGEGFWRAAQRRPYIFPCIPL